MCIRDRGCRAGVYISHSDIEEMINYLSGYSFHAIAPQLAAGYFTVEGGHRVGIAGQMGDVYKRQGDTGQSFAHRLCVCHTRTH